MYNNWSKCYLNLGNLPLCEACKLCLVNVENNIYQPCQTCKALKFYFPNVTTVGNIFKLPTFKAELQQMKLDMEETYQRRSCIGLQPTELRKIGSYLLSDVGKTESQVEANFQSWVMILVSVSIFLRFDECCNLEMMDFEKEQFTITENGTDNLAIWVRGKTDSKRNLLSLLGNCDFFDLNVLPPLMIYIGKRGLTDSKYLFGGKDSQTSEQFL